MKRMSVGVQWTTSSLKTTWFARGIVVPDISPLAESGTRRKNYSKSKVQRNKFVRVLFHYRSIKVNRCTSSLACANSMQNFLMLYSIVLYSLPDRHCFPISLPTLPGPRHQHPPSGNILLVRYPVALLVKPPVPIYVVFEQCLSPPALPYSSLRIKTPTE